MRLVKGEVIRTRLGSLLPSIVISIVFLVVAFIALYPVLMLVYGSFRTAAPGAGGAFTLRNYVEAYADPQTYKLFFNTFLIIGSKTILATLLAVILAWIVTRTNTPFRRALEILIVIPLFIPHILEVMGWVLLLSPRTGLINVALMRLLGLKEAPLNIYSLGGIIWTMTLGSLPTIFFLVVSAFKAMDASLEEAAYAAGSSTFSVLYRITLPLMAPTILGISALTFISGMEAFEAPVLLGLPAKIFLFTSQIYAALEYGSPPKYGVATALAVTLLVVTALLIFLQWRLLRGKEFFVITGKGYRPHLIDLGCWRYVTLAFCLLFFFIATALPLSQLVMGSFLKVFGIYSWKMVTLDNYRRILVDKVVWQAMQNTFVLAAIGAALTLLLSAGVSYIITRTCFPGRKVLDFISWVPWTVPGLVMGLGLLWAYIILPKPIEIYGTVWILLVAFVTGGIPVGVRLMSGGLMQISRELEEVAWAHGASWLQSFRTIILNLLRPALVSGGVYLFVRFVRALSPVILLYGHGTELLSVAIFSFWSAGEVEIVCALSLIMLLIIATALALAKVFKAFGILDELAT